MSSLPTAVVNAGLDAQWGTDGSSTGFLGILTAITDGAAGDVTESTDGAYARQAITWAAASARSKASSADNTFPTTVSANPAVAGFGIYAAATGGSVQRVRAVASLPYGVGIRIVVEAGATVLTEADWTSGLS